MRGHSHWLLVTNLLVDNLVQISSYLYKVLPIAITLQHKHITRMT